MKILFITSTRIGDAVLTTGVLDYLLATYPDARVTIACGPQAAPLFEAVPRCDKVIAMVKGPRARHWRALWRDCVGTHWDMIVDLRRSVVSWLLRASQRYNLGNSKERVHRVRQIADVFDLPEAPMPRIWIHDDHRAEAARLIPDGPVLGIGPTANWEAKTWPATSFIELIERLTAPTGPWPDAPVAVFAAPDEEPRARSVVEAVPEERRIDLVGKLDLLTAYACLERCGCFIGNDSALMHLAAASGIPTLGLFGPSEDVFYAPWGWKTDFIRTPEGFDTIFPENFDHRTSGSLMASLTVDAVEQAVIDLCRKTDAGGRTAA